MGLEELATTLRPGTPTLRITKKLNKTSQLQNSYGIITIYSKLTVAASCV